MKHWTGHVAFQIRQLSEGARGEVPTREHKTDTIKPKMVCLIRCLLRKTHTTSAMHGSEALTEALPSETEVLKQNL